MSIASRRDNLKDIMRRELPFTFGGGAVESIIGLDETNYELNLDQDSRLLTLENNETIYQVFSYVGTSASGQVPVYQESSIFDIYNDGLVDAIAVKADGNQKPIEEIVTDSSGNQITVTLLIDNLDNTANYILSGTPTENACIVYFLKIKDEFRSNIPEDNIIPPSINVKSNPLTTIIVADAGGDFTNQKDALASISPDVNNRYAIIDYRSVGTEDNPIQLKPYVTIKSAGNNNTTRIVASNPNQDLYLGSNLCYLIGFSFFGVTGISNYAVNHSAVGEMLVQQCVFTDCSNGMLINNVNAFMNILDCALYTIDPGVTTMNCGVCITAGNVTLDFLKIITISKITTVIDCVGPTSILTLNNIIAFSPNVTTVLNADDGCRISGYGSRMVACYDGIVIKGNDTQVRLDVVQIFNAQNDGFRVENPGSGIELSLFATTISGCTRWNFNVENPNSTVSGNGFTEIEKGFIIEGAKFFAYLLDITEGDAGLHVLGEFKVGSVENPAESSLGEGDSTTRGMKVFTYNGSVYTDVTDAAKSASGSTFAFPNTLVNTAIYISSELIQSGDMYRHHGIKTLLNTAAVGGEIVVEYWNGAWIELNASEIEASGKYFPFAKQYFQKTGSYQLRYDPSLNNDDWTKNNPMGYTVSLYWIRFRITTQITTAPIFEQWKYHVNRFEPNADGFIEYFGMARPIGQLTMNVGTSKPIEGNMQSQSIYISENIGIGFIQNKFTTTADILGFNGRVPFNLDTSADVKLVWSGMFNTSHTPEFTIRWGWVGPGDELYTSEPGQVNNYHETTVSRAVTLNINEVFEALLDVSDMIARRENSFGDELWISIQITTLIGTFSITTGTADYTMWCAGGHV